MKRHGLLISYCLFAVVINFIPFIGLPFRYLSTIFHELSHGLATLLTGGAIVEFALQANGAGHLVSRGGSSIIIAFSGYFGAALWGGLLYQVGRHQLMVQITLGFLIALFSLTLILWVNGLMTAFILLGVIALLVLILVRSKDRWLTYVAQLMAILVLFNAINSPLYLLDGRHIGDGANLANYTFIPEIVWVMIWFVWALFILYRLAKSKPSQATQ